MNVIMTTATCLTVVGAFLACGVYWKILKETQRTRQDQQMPVLSFRLRERENQRGTIHNIVWSYRIANAGSGPAFITKFEIMDSRLFGKEMDRAHKIDTVIGPSSGDPELEVEYGSEAQITQELKEIIPELRDGYTHYAIEYKDVFGRKYRTEFKNRRHYFSGPF